MDLGQVGVAGFFDERHHAGDALRAGDGVEAEQRRAEPHPVDRRPDPLAEQAVAAAQVVIEERQRRADGEGVQPQAELGEFDRHRVLVDAVDDPLEDDRGEQADGRSSNLSSIVHLLAAASAVMRSRMAARRSSSGDR